MSDVANSIPSPWWRRFRGDRTVSLSARSNAFSTRVPTSALWAGLAILSCIVFVLAIGRGAYQIPSFNVIGILLQPIGLNIGTDINEQQAAVLWSIRLPRVLLGIAVGAGAAASGTLLQGLFRNPLADPGLIGVTNGAALAAAFVIVMGGSAMPWLSQMLGGNLLPVAAFMGGTAVVLLVQRTATRDGVTSVAAMLLTGIAMAALAGAGIGMLVYTASDAQTRALAFWTLGSLASANWTVVAIVGACVALTVIASRFLAPQLNAMVLGETEARHLGVDTQWVKNIVLFLALLAVGASVAFCGMIGFIGLVAPHCIRLLCGPDHRTLIPASALLGAVLTVAADLVARTIVAPAELPIGILTALLGVPFFLILLRRQRGQWSA
jgi:iron complex transport system permease protein